MLWTTETATTAAKPVTASLRPSIAHPSPTLLFTSIPSATSTATLGASRIRTATTLTTNVRELSGVNRHKDLRSSLTYTPIHYQL